MGRIPNHGPYPRVLSLVIALFMGHCSGTCRDGRIPIIGKLEGQNPESL
jgi:hypothetical protein